MSPRASPCPAAYSSAVVPWASVAFTSARASRSCCSTPRSMQSKPGMPFSEASSICDAPSRWKGWPTSSASSSSALDAAYSSARAAWASPRKRSLFSVLP
eukprot:6139838-Prymnesium_polylepis.1